MTIFTVILATLVLLNIFFATIGPPNCSNHKKAHIELHRLGQSIEAFKIDTGQKPERLEDLSVNPAVQGWLGPYIAEKDMIDPWGHAYRYVPIHQPDQIILYHLGADGEVGGAKTARDGFLLHTLDGDAAFIEPVSLP